MADNIAENPMDGPTNTKSEHTSDPTENTRSINPNQTTKKVEPPAHEVHKPGMGWKHYFFEFLMLFLAVFAGFLAENQRENLGERQREKKFARRLLSDLRQDSIFFEIRIQLLEQRQNAHDQFLKVMTKSVRPTDSEIMKGFVPLLAGNGNDFTTATYNQMKASGSLRYITNDDLTTALQKYYDVLLARASRDSDGADRFFTGDIISYMTKHFRFQDLRPVEGKLPDAKLLNRSAASDQELINLMGVWASNCDTQLNLLRPAQHQMSDLINLIENEYHLE